MLPTRHIDTLHPAYGIRDSRTCKPSLTVPTPSVFGPVTRRRQASRQAGRQVGRQASPSRQPAGTRSRRSSDSGRSVHLPLHPAHHLRITSGGGRISSTYVAAYRHPAGRLPARPLARSLACRTFYLHPGSLPCFLPSLPSLRPAFYLWQARAAFRHDEAKRAGERAGEAVADT